MALLTKIEIESTCTIGACAGDPSRFIFVPFRAAERRAGAPKKAVGQISEPTDNHLQFLFVFQVAEVIIDRSGDNSTQLLNVTWSRSIDYVDHLGEVVTVPFVQGCLLEFLKCECSKPVDLVLDRHSKDFGMLDERALAGQGNGSSCAKVVEVVEVLNHQLHYLGHVARVVCVLSVV